MRKQNMLYPTNKILFSRKRQWRAGLRYDTGLQHTAEWKKADLNAQGSGSHLYEMPTIRNPMGAEGTVLVLKSVVWEG